MYKKSTNKTFKNIIGSIIILVVVQTSLALFAGVLDNGFTGTDPYMWLNRVLYLNDGGDWFGSLYPRVNPPYGHEQHWTRPFDVLLFTGAFVGAPFFGFDKALYIWGILISPVLQIVALVLLFWAISPVLKQRESEVLGILFACNVAILMAFRVGRPDHQGLVCLLFITSLGFNVRLLLLPFRRKWCYGAGLVNALAVWVSIESVLVVLATLICLGSFWLIEEWEFSCKLSHYSMSLFFGVAFFLLAERGLSGFLTPEFDQISIVYVSLFGLIFIYWGAFEAFKVRCNFCPDWRGRILCAVCGAAVIATIMECLFPGFLSGPLGKVDDLYRRVRLEKIAEIQPLFSLSALSSGEWKRHSSRFILFLGIAIPGIPVLIIHLKKKQESDFRSWVYIAVCILVFVTLTFQQVRWVPYAVILLLLPYSWFVEKILCFLDRRISGIAAVLLRTLSIIFLCTWFIYPYIVAAKSAEANSREKYPLKLLSEYLEDPEGLGERSRNILAFTDFGPELLYRTRHAVYSIPNHRFQPGFTETYRIMTATDNDMASKIAAKLRVDLILICIRGPGQMFYQREDGLQTFHQRLAEGQLPVWLHELALPSGLSASFRLFEFKKSSWVSN